MGGAAKDSNWWLGELCIQAIGGLSRSNSKQSGPSCWDLTADSSQSLLVDV